MVVAALFRLPFYACPLSCLHYATALPIRKDGIAEVMPWGYGGFTSALLPHFFTFLGFISASFPQTIFLLPQFLAISGFISAVFGLFGLHFRIFIDRFEGIYCPCLRIKQFFQHLLLLLQHIDAPIYICFHC